MQVNDRVTVKTDGGPCRAAVATAIYTFSNTTF